MRAKHWLFVLVPLVILLSGCPFFNKLPVWETIPNLIMKLGDPVCFSLSTYCTDPDGDPLTFSVVSGPGTIVGSNYEWTLSLPGGERTVEISASDGKGESTASFQITVKTPPNVPSNPIPTHDSIFQNHPNIELAWNGGDPDGDSVTYDLYFGVSASPPRIASGLSSAEFGKTGLKSFTKYYWKIVAKDGQNSVSGPLWQFTTGPYLVVNENFESRALGTPVLPWATYEPQGSTAEITNRGHSGKALTFYDSVNSDWARVIRTGLTPIRKGSVQFDFRVITGGTFGFRETVYLVPYVYIGGGAGDSGIWTYNNESQVFTKIYPISGATWYNVYIYFDFDARMYSVYVDNILRKTEYFAGNYSFTAFNFQVFSGSTCEYADIDNVIIRAFESDYSPSSMEVTEEALAGSSEK